MKETKSTCPYCGVGCGVLAEIAADGKTLISSGGPTSAYIWGLEPPSWRKSPPTGFDDKGLTQAWERLAAADGASTLDGEMVDAATKRLAESVLARASEL